MPMQLRLRTKLTLVMTALVLLVVAVLSVAFLGQLLQTVLEEKRNHATDLAKEVFIHVKNALTDASLRGVRVSSSEPQDLHDYARYSMEISEGLKAQLQAAVENPIIYEVSITDDDGMVLVSSDKNLPGQFLARRTPLSQLIQRGFLQQIKVLRGP